MHNHISKLACLLFVIFFTAHSVHGSIYTPYLPKHFRSVVQYGIPGSECIISGRNCTCLPPTPPGENNPPLELLDLLTRGSEFLQNYTDVNQAVLMLGNTGAGKTTATQIMAGNLSRLHAVLDTGKNLVIIDEDNRIGLPSTKSKTLFPEMVVKPGSEEVPALPFYDFPGFDDTRGPVQDIAANFFITEVVKKVSNVKMLFVVIYSSVSGQDRIDFDLLARHATKFVKDITKYTPSFALVVNKVKSFNDWGEYVPDDDIITGIVGFLKGYNNTLHDSLGSGDPDQDEETSKKIIFVETLLQQNEEGKYSRLWFIRTPLTCGQLSLQPAVIDTIGNITEMYEQLDFTQVAENDFGFTLKDRTRLEIANYTLSLNKAISAAVAEIVSDFRRMHVQQIHVQNSTLVALSQKLQADSMNFKILVEKLAKTTDSVEFSNELLEFSTLSGYHLSRKFQNFMQWQNTFFLFFDKAAEADQERRISEWTAPILELATHLDNFFEWYQFCANLEETVYGYSFHSKKPSPPQPSNNFDWLKFIEEQGILSVSDRVKQAAQYVPADDLAILETLLTFALVDTKTNCHSPTNSLTVQANFLRASDLAKEITICGNANQVHVHVAHTLFLDIDIRLETMDLVIISPFWVNTLEQQRSISAKGQEGPGYATPGASGEPGYDDNHKPTAGAPACAGKPGTPGNSAFCVVMQVNSTQAVLVDTSGGNGGPGQQGGTGGHGWSRRDANWNIASNEWNRPDNCIYDSAVNGVWSYQDGLQGQSGATGGNGGVGGEGGYPTVGAVIALEGNGVEILSEKGAKGELGPGGTGGSAGRCGNGYVCKNAENCQATETRCEATDGVKGTPGVSQSCLLAPQQPTKRIVEWQSFLEYRLQNFNYTNPTTVEFFHKLDMNKNLLEYFTLKALANESLALENISRETVNLERLRDIYLSHIQRLEYYSKKHFESSSEEHQKVITMLLVSSFSSLMSLRAPMGRTMIVDVAGYIDIVVNQINVINAITNRDEMKATVETEKTKFQNNLNEKINQATLFLETIVTPALNEAADDVGDKVELLGKQLEGLIEDVSLSLEDAREKLKEAERQQRLHAIFKVFSVFTGFVSGFIPGGDLFDKMVGGLGEKYAGAEDQVERLNELVKELEEMSKDLEEKRHEFEENFVPLVDSLLVYFENVSQSLSEGGEVSAPQLGLTKWQLLGKLEECKNSLEMFSDESLNTKTLVNAFNKVQDAMVFSIELYEMIDHYLETKSLAEYIAIMQSATLGPIEIKDPEYADILKEFDTKVKQNLLEQEVKKALHAFRQWVFPFAKFYLVSGANPIAQIGYLQTELERYKRMVVGDQDTFIFQTNFSSGLQSSKPFFTWENEKWLNEIKNFTSGLPVHLNADVRLQGLQGREAIKFKLIEINLKLNGASEEMQTEFDQLLDYFGVVMTHSGVSYYRFQQDYFMMAGSNQTIQYNFERDANGNRLGTNLVYEKFKSGDFLLSPYTGWTIQLLNVVPINKGFALRRDVSFESFEKFVPYIDIELIGMGTYVDGQKALEAAGGKLNLDKFYERDSRLKTPFSF